MLVLSATLWSHLDITHPPIHKWKENDVYKTLSWLQIPVLPLTRSYRQVINLNRK